MQEDKQIIEIVKVEEVAEKIESKIEEKKYISIDDFKKIEIKIGKILSVDTIEGADKLYKFAIDLGEPEPRTILSGIREFYTDPSVLVGRSVPVVSNLAPKKIRGVESNGMILFAVGDEHSFLHTISPETDVPTGTNVQ